ncbi:MAG: CBS domain-containing protein [Flavobacterium sp.]|nr:CBS domain-containing protein [Candidatus Neoflavobacterium equi]
MKDMQQYISNEIPPLQLTDKVQQALDYVADYNMTHLPVMRDGIFIGNISSEELYDADDSQALAEINLDLMPFFTRNTTNWFDVLQIFNDNDTNRVPVLNDLNQYVGYYELSTIVEVFAETPFLKEEGNTIIVEKNLSEYSMSEIAQIIETNNCKLYGLFISEINQGRIQVAIKLSMGNMNEILQTFRRYEYDIISEHLDDTYINALKHRSDYLDKYLNL